MLKLMKYEFRKSASSKLILLVLTAVFELAFLGGVFFKGYNLMGTGMMFLILCAFFGVFYIGLEGIMTLYRDLNSKQSYMLFLTPKSSYEILGAKILENGISILMAGAFFIVLAVFDLTVATLCIGGAKELMDSIRQIMDIRLNIKIASDAVILSVFASLVSWISIVVIADMAVILSVSVLAGKKGSGIAAFALFLILSWLFSQMLNLVPAFDNMNLTMILEIAVSLVLSVIFYFISGWIMEKKLSV